MVSLKYQQLSDSEEQLGQEQEKIEKNVHYLHKSRSFPWICSTICLLFLLGAQSFYYTHVRKFGTYETGFATDFGPSIPIIDIIEVEFSGNLQYTETGHLYIDLDRDGVRYFGTPGPEVDQAWKNLIGEHLTFPISDEDAKALNNNHPVYPGWVGPDVLHTLHCVNEIRKVLDSEHYYNATLKELKRVKRLHIDHCLNHIRQVIQCHLDLTPAPSMYFASVDTFVGNFNQVHTCRDISKLREWMAERSSKQTSGPGNPTSNSSQHGYIDNDDALLPWDWTEHEFQYRAA